MNIRISRFLPLLALIAALCVIPFWMSRDSERISQPVIVPQPAQAINEEGPWTSEGSEPLPGDSSWTSEGGELPPGIDGPPPDTAFYVYGTGLDFWDGEQTFGNMHKVGVENEVYQQYANRMSDFEFIRDDIQAREQFVQSLGYQFQYANRHWQVDIPRVKTVNGEVRFSVFAYAGIDRENEHCLIDGYCVNELWRIGSGSNPPTLLERTHWMKLGEQCKTLAELGIQPNSPELGAPFDGNVGDYSF